MHRRTRISRRWLRSLCVVSTLLGSAANVALLVGFRWILPALGVPFPKDPYLFVVETLLSFTIGTVAYFAVRQRTNVDSLLAVGVLGKWLYAVTTFVFCALGSIPPFFYAAVAWDACLVVLFFLYWIQAKGDDLFELGLDVFDGIDNPDRADRKRALLLRMAIRAQGDGSAGLDRIKEGLTRRGYEVDVAEIVPQEAVFGFPRSWGAAVRVFARAVLRMSARVAPLTVPKGRDWDLVAVESPDWVFGVAAPVEAMLLDPANRWIFQGRDAVALVVSRGAHRRSMSMIVRYLERAGANVVAARAFVDRGSDARRFPQPVAAPHYALAAKSATEAESLGTSLGDRSRKRPHWTLLLDQAGRLREEKGDA